MVLLVNHPEDNRFWMPWIFFTSKSLETSQRKPPVGAPDHGSGTARCRAMLCYLWLGGDWAVNAGNFSWLTQWLVVFVKANTKLFLSPKATRNKNLWSRTMRMKQPCPWNSLWRSKNDEMGYRISDIGIIYSVHLSKWLPLVFFFKARQPTKIAFAMRRLQTSYRTSKSGHRSFTSLGVFFPWPVTGRSKRVWNHEFAFGKNTQFPQFLQHPSINLRKLSKMQSKLEVLTAPFWQKAKNSEKDRKRHVIVEKRSIVGQTFPILEES